MRSLPEASSIGVCRIEGAGRPGGKSWPASPRMIRSASVVVTLRFGTIDWVLGGGESSETGGESPGTEGGISGTGGDETSEADKEESPVSVGCCSGGSRVSVIVTSEEEMSSSTSRDCTWSGEIVMSRYPR